MAQKMNLKYIIIGIAVVSISVISVSFLQLSYGYKILKFTLLGNGNCDVLENHKCCKIYDNRIKICFRYEWPQEVWIDCNISQPEGESFFGVYPPLPPEVKYNCSNVYINAKFYGYNNQLDVEIKDTSRECTCLRSGVLAEIIGLKFSRCFC